MVAQLPIELLQLIVQDATPESLRSFRLVDRHWSAASTPYLFARFNVSLFSGPLANLTALSQSPLAKHVKAIDFHFDELPGYSREEWEGKLDSRPGFLTWRAGFSGDDVIRATSRAYEALHRHEYTEVQLEAGWSTYQRHYEEQKYWADGEVGHVLRDGLSRFQNLNQVVVGRTKPFSDWEAGRKYWKHFMRDMLVKRDAWFYRRTLVKEYESLSRLLMTAAVGHRNSIPGMNPVQALEMELPEKFSFRDMIYSPPHCPLGHFGRALPGPTDPSERYAIVVEAFRPLRRLTLQCPSVPDDEDLENKSQIRELDSLLTAANGLEYLVLDFGEPGRSYENADVEDNHMDHAIIPILSRTWATFPHLRELKIMGSYPSESLLVFLAAHSSTLKFVGILDSFSDDWYKVLEYIGQLKLSDIYLECLWQPGPASAFGGDPDMLLPMGLEADDNFALAMKAYLSTGEGPVPREDDFES